MRSSDWSSDVCSSDLVRLFVAPINAIPATLQVSGQVADAAADEAGCGVQTTRGSADLAVMFNSFRKQAPSGEIVPLRESREQGLPRLLMVDSTPLGHVSATGQLKKPFLESWLRSEDRRVGKECVSTSRYRGAPVA